MSDGLQHALAESLRMNTRLLTLLEEGGVTRRRDRSRSRRCCSRCGACRERSQSWKWEPRAKLLPRKKGWQKDDSMSQSSSAPGPIETEYMQYVEKHFQNFIEDTMKNTASHEEDS